MSMHTLEELSVPQPPYRMKRPEAVLAANPGEPVIASTEGEVLIPPPEALPPSPEAPSSPAERIAESSAVMESANQAARDKLDKPSLTDATPEESGQDDANRQSSLSKIETTSTEGAAKVQEAAARSYNTLDDLERERDRLMAIAQQEGPDTKRGGLAMKGAILLGPMVEKKRAAQTQLIVEQQPEAAATPAPQEAKVPVSQMKKLEGESEGEFRQRKYAEKTPAKQKEEKTRSEDAAKAEDAVREEKKLEEGIEFKQPEESTTEKASRIGREALEKLKDFKNAQDRGAKPEELEFARQQADLAQKRAEAAKRGENIPEERVDMAKVEAAGAQPKETDEVPMVEAEPMVGTIVPEKGKVVGYEPSGKAVYEAVDLQGETAADRAENLRVQAEEAMKAIESDPASQEYLKKQGYVYGVDEAGYFKDKDGKPTNVHATQIIGNKPAEAEALRRGDERVAAQRQDTAEQARATNEGMRSTPSVEISDSPEAITQKEPSEIEELSEQFSLTGEQIQERLKYWRATATGDEEARAGQLRNLLSLPQEEFERLEERPLAAPAEVGSERVNIKPGTAEATPAPTQERAAATQEQLIAQLQEQVAQFQQQVAQLQAQLSGRPAAAPAEAAPATPAAEGQPASPERPARIREIGEQQGLSFFEKYMTKRKAGGEDWKAAIATILAKKWQGRLEGRNEKIKMWEERGKEAAKSGAIGTAKSLLWHEPWANYHRWRGRNAYRKQEAWNDERVRRENNRDEILNQGAARIDRLLDSQRERIDQYALERDERDDLLDKQHAEHKEFTELLGLARTSDERSQIRDHLKTLEKEMTDAAEKKQRAEAQWQAERRRATKQQSRKEELLSYAVRPTRIDTKPKEDYEWLVQRKKRPGGSPKARSGARRIPGTAA